MSEAKVASMLKPRPAPSSLTEVGQRLDEIVLLLNHVLQAIKTLTDEVTGVHQERVDLVQRVTDLEHEVALLKGGRDAH